MTTTMRFEDWLARRMEEPGFREAMEELEPGYQVARLRMRRGLTQSELAERVGTKQSSIARLESGKRQPSLSFLRRVAKSLGARLEVRIRLDDEPAARRLAAEAIASKPMADLDDAGIEVLNWPGYEHPNGMDYTTADVVSSAGLEREPA
jgi:transcriptional regulator with XRE-family HTH domain